MQEMTFRGESRLSERALPRGTAKPQLCLLCRGEQHTLVFKEFDTDVLRCRGCGHVFSSYQADPHFDGFWGEEVLAPDPYWSVAREPMYEDFRRRFVEGRSGSLLDMGCGLGFFVKSIGQHPGWKAFGCEISPAAVRYAREQLGLANVFCTRLDKADLPVSSFDIITMWDVIDHILEPDPLLRRCHALLGDGALLFLRTPNIQMQLLRARGNQLRGAPPDAALLRAREHLHHYSPWSIQELLRRNGFSEIRLLHLRPVLAPRGAPRWHQLAKRTWFEGVRSLAVITGGRLNLDNLFVTARKRA
jgi:SAM-dependent methyltransferase